LRAALYFRRPDKALAAIRRMAWTFVLLPDGTTFIRPTGSVVLSRPDKVLAAIRRMAWTFVLMPDGITLIGPTGS
ncbi:hypothetical protein OGY37_00190, partial [Citrobacter sp. Cpo030]|uniref:hypothetical protein n=1 Tax=Citrobacter sp. Cpo030 TaxID=2985122 RepID=UPI002575A1CE